MLFVFLKKAMWSHFVIASVILIHGSSQVQASCSAPPAVSNSYLLTSSPYANGSSAAYGCNSRYTLAGTSSLLCFNGLWVGTIPVCELIDYTTNRYIIADNETPTWVLILISILVAIFLFTILALLLWYCCFHLGCCCYSTHQKGGGLRDDGEGPMYRSRHRRGRRRPRILHVSPMYSEDSFVSSYYNDEPQRHHVTTTEVQTDHHLYNGNAQNGYLQNDLNNKPPVVHNAAVQVYHIDGYLRNNQVGHASVQTSPRKKKKPASDPDLSNHKLLSVNDSYETASVPSKHGSIDRGSVITPKMVNVSPTSAPETRKHWKTVGNYVKQESAERSDTRFSSVITQLVDEGKIRKPAKDPRQARPLWMPHSQTVRNINTSTK